MRYDKLSCIDFYSCYLQQCLSIDLFYYCTPDCGQMGPIKKVCPFCLEVFLEWLFSFSGTQRGFRCPCGVAHYRAKFFENNILPLKWGKWKFILITVCLNRSHIWENSGSWDYGQILLKLIKIKIQTN